MTDPTERLSDEQLRHIAEGYHAPADDSGVNNCSRAAAGLLELRPEHALALNAVENLTRACDAATTELREHRKHLGAAGITHPDVLNEYMAKVSELCALEPDTPPEFVKLAVGNVVAVFNRLMRTDKDEETPTTGE